MAHHPHPHHTTSYRDHLRKSQMGPMFRFCPIRLLRLEAERDYVDLLSSGCRPWMWHVRSAAIRTPRRPILSRCALPMLRNTCEKHRLLSARTSSPKPRRPIDPCYPVL